MNLDDVHMDWTDFDAAAEASRRVLAELASDRQALRALVLAVGKNAHLLSLCEKVRDFKYLVLYDALDRGLRLRLHRFSATQQDEPHNHRYSFSSHILKGAYRHTLYDATEEPGRERWHLRQPPDTYEGGDLPTLPLTRLATLMTQTQPEGTSYSMHHAAYHAAALPGKPAYSLFLRGPAEKDAAVFFDLPNQTYRWKFGRAQEGTDALTARSFTAEDYAQFVRELAADGVI
jgi:hypothetical protein